MLSRVTFSMLHSLAKLLVSLILHFTIWVIKLLEMLTKHRKILQKTMNVICKTHNGN